MQSKSRRADPLPPEERRREIVSAVVPLLARKGATVTTSEMAEAAGVAEGTLFTVFPDKPAVIFKAIEMTLDPVPVCDALGEIDPLASLETQLTEAAEILLARFETVSALVEVVRSMRDAGRGRSDEARRLVIESNATISAALSDLLARHHRSLRVDPSRAISAFRGLIFAGGSPLMPSEHRLTSSEIVSILLHGTVRKADV